MLLCCPIPFAGNQFFMDPVDNVSDPVCLCGSGQGWTPPVSLHRLWTQQRAAEEEAAAQDHQQGTVSPPWQRDRQGPRAQYIVRRQETKQKQLFQWCCLLLHKNTVHRLKQHSVHLLLWQRRWTKCCPSHHRGFHATLCQAVCLLNTFSPLTCSASSLQRAYHTWPCATAASLLLKPSASWKICGGSSQHVSIALLLPWQPGHIHFWNLVSRKRNINA